jgi:branched-chain amino acid aminotransferase
MRPLWLDGEIVPYDLARVSALSHAMHRGSLVFDFSAFHPTPRGVAVFRLGDHVARFLRSASIVGLEIAHDRAVLEAATLDAVRASGLSEGYLRWSAFIGTFEPDLVPRSMAARVAIAAYEPGDLLALGEAPKAKRTTLRVAVFDDARKASAAALPPLAKVAAAYLGPMLARRRAVAAGADEVVLVGDDGFVAEAPTANVFAVVRGTLVTPPLGRILDGITRDSVIAIAHVEGVETREEPLSVAALASADEAFLTASSFPIAPIAAVNGVALSGAPGAVTRRLMDRLAATERGADSEFAAWTALTS